MQINLDIDPAAVDTDGIADALPITVADADGIADALPTGTSWTQAGDSQYITESVNSGKSQHIIVTTVADETTPQSTMTLVGTDRDDAAITENLTLPNAGTVVSTKQFKTITGISVDEVTTGVVDVGWIITSWNFAETALWLATGAGDGLAHQLSIRTYGNEPAGTSPLLTLIGTDADGKVQTETVTLPNISTVETTKYFLTVTEGSTADKTLAGVLDIGWVDEVASKTIKLAWEKHVPSNWWLDVTGTVNLSVQFTQDDHAAKTDQNDVFWVEGDSNLTAETGDSTAMIVVPAGFSGARVIFNTYSAGAELQLRGTQAEAK